MAQPADGIDRETPARLRRQGGEKLVKDLARVFLVRAPERLRALREADTAAVVADQAHAFKTSCRIVGALAMGDLCETLEVAAEKAVLPSPAQLDELERRFGPVRSWLEDVQRQADAAP